MTNPPDRMTPVIRAGNRRKKHRHSNNLMKQKTVTIDGLLLLPSKVYIINQ